MKKVLIINLRRLGDIYSSAHLINSIAAAGPAQISLLVYQESAKAAQSLTNVSKVHTINRHEIISLKNNKIFSDVDALSELYNQTADIKNQVWDQVINFSNDSVGTYLTSYFKNNTQSIAGVHYDEHHLTRFNNDWTIMFNDVLTGINLSPLHFIDCYHRMSGIPYSFVGNKISTSAKYNEDARSQMNSIREAAEGGGKTAKIVGIQLKTSTALKDLPAELIKDFIFLMKKSPDLIPALLIAPTDNERQCANLISENFDDGVVVIESDLETLPSVLTQLDLLVTPDTATKHVANLTGTPVLEISLGTSPFFKQGSYATDTYILTESIDTRSFSGASPTKITGMDIISSVLYIFTAAKTIKPLFSPQVALYGSRFDKLGICYTLISGNSNSQTEISRLMNRQLTSVLMLGSEIDNLYSEVNSYGKSIVTRWAEQERSNITQFMRDLLATMRALLQGQSGKDNSREFVTNLGRLLNYCGTSEMTQIPCLYFKGRLEQVRGTTVEENTKEVEILLQELKSNVLKVLFLITQIDGTTSETKMSRPTMAPQTEI